jgi:hypothetical protein
VQLSKPCKARSARVRVRGTVDLFDVDGCVLQPRHRSERHFCRTPPAADNVRYEASSLCRLDTVTKSKTVHVVQQSFRAGPDHAKGIQFSILLILAERSRAILNASYCFKREKASISIPPADKRTSRKSKRKQFRKPIGRMMSLRKRPSVRGLVPAKTSGPQQKYQTVFLTSTGNIPSAEPSRNLVLQHLFGNHTDALCRADWAAPR